MFILSNSFLSKRYFENNFAAKIEVNDRMKTNMGAGYLPVLPPANFKFKLNRLSYYLTPEVFSS